MSREPTVRPGACDREDLRIALGALALGALDVDEAREVRRHLADCPECQAEYTSFVGVKRVMDVGLVGAPTPTPALAEVEAEAGAGAAGAAGEKRAARPRRAPFRTPLRRRIATAAAGCVAAAGLVFGGFVAGLGSSTAASVPATALPAVTRSGVTAQISYEGQGWGTWIQAKMSGTPDGVKCTLYVYDKNHDAIPLSSWTAVDGKTIDVPAATSLPPNQIDHFEVRVAENGYDIVVPMTS